MTQGTLLVSERLEIPVKAKVVRDEAFQFLALPRRLNTTAVVLHWTGGAGLGPQVYRTLRTRRLSVHLCVEPDGTVYQYANLDRICAHAGSVDDSDHDGHQESANRTTIGIEIVNPAGQETMVRGVRRPLLRETIHGKELVYSAFTQEQTDAAIDLCFALCGHYGLPLRVPMSGNDVLSTVMSESQWRQFRGVAGHLQLTARKVDPGLALLRAINALPVRGLNGAAE